MATVHFYNHTLSRFIVSQSNGAADDYFVLLLDADGVAAFDPTHTTLTEVTNAGAYEVYGNGWTQGGEAIGNPTFSSYDSGDIIFDADDVSVPITGGELGPFSGYVVFNGSDADDPPLYLVEFDSPQTISENYLAVIEWPVTGLLWFTRT